MSLTVIGSSVSVLTSSRGWFHSICTASRPTAKQIFNFFTKFLIHEHVDERIYRGITRDQDNGGDIKHGAICQ